MPHSATRLVLIIFATLFVVSAAWVGASEAQDEASGAAVIHRGNTDIVFENAGMSGLPAPRYTAFDQFASEHPEIADALARNPRLIENESFAESPPGFGRLPAHSSRRSEGLRRESRQLCRHAARSRSIDQ